MISLSAVLVMTWSSIKGAFVESLLTFSFNTVKKNWFPNPSVEVNYASGACGHLYLIIKSIYQDAKIIALQKRMDDPSSFIFHLKTVLYCNNSCAPMCNCIALSYCNQPKICVQYPKTCSRSTVRHVWCFQCKGHSWRTVTGKHHEAKYLLLVFLLL